MFVTNVIIAFRIKFCDDWSIYFNFVLNICIKFLYICTYLESIYISYDKS